MNKDLLIKTAIEVKKLATRAYIERDVDMTLSNAESQRREARIHAEIMYQLRVMDAVIDRLERKR